MIIAILTGQRPELLKRTIDAFVPYLTDNYVLVLHNGGDKPTARLLKKYKFIDKVITTPDFLPNGTAMSAIAKEVIKSGEHYFLMLEDDFEYQDPSNDWLNQAMKLLNHPTVGQVRLRLDSEPVLAHNMVNKQKIRWQEYPTYKIGNGHYTNTPNLMRVRDLHKVWPAYSELSAQKRFNLARFQVAQLIPGCFSHTGGDASLENHKWV